jgi:hypothetical protein
MESPKTASTSDASFLTASTSISILGEIVGATNLVAALREEDAKVCESSPPLKIESINASCVVYWGDELIHKTKTIPKK